MKESRKKKNHEDYRLSICIGCLNKPKGLRPIENEKVVGTLNQLLVNEKSGNKSILSLVQECLKLESDQMNHLPTAICTHCRLAMLKCENIADYPISVRYSELIENVKSNAISNDTEECICEICVLGKVIHPKYYKHLKKDAHQSHLGKQEMCWFLAD